MSCRPSTAPGLERVQNRYAEHLEVGKELFEADRDRLEFSLVVSLYRSGDLPAWYGAAIDLAQRAERRGDRLLLARIATAMEATGDVAWDSQVSRVCEQALNGSDLPDAVRANVLARYAQALAYRSEYERAGSTSRDALDLAESTGDPSVVVEALRVRQLACSAPEGSDERVLLATRMREMGEQMRNATVEMWGRLWQVDTLFETGQLAMVPSALIDLSSCIERVHRPEARWHLLEYSAVAAHAAGRYEDAIRLAGQAFEVMRHMGHPLAVGGYAGRSSCGSVGHRERSARTRRRSRIWLGRWRSAKRTALVGTLSRPRSNSPRRSPDVERPVTGIDARHSSRPPTTPRHSSECTS